MICRAGKGPGIISATTFPVNLFDKCAPQSSLMPHAQPVISQDKASPVEILHSPHASLAIGVKVEPWTISSLERAIWKKMTDVSTTAPLSHVLPPNQLFTISNLSLPQPSPYFRSFFKRVAHFRQFLPPIKALGAGKGAEGWWHRDGADIGRNFSKEQDCASFRLTLICFFVDDELWRKWFACKFKRRFEVGVG